MVLVALEKVYHYLNPYIQSGALVLLASLKLGIGWRALMGHSHELLGYSHKGKDQLTKLNLQTVQLHVVMTSIFGLFIYRMGISLDLLVNTVIS